MDNKNRNKKNKYIFCIEIFVLIMLNIFLILSIDEFTNDRFKFTLVCLIIVTSMITLIVSIINFLRKKYQ